MDVNVEAFETDEEANLVNALRDDCVSYISLVAEEGDEVVGHQGIIKHHSAFGSV